jgi:hypothetical protein
VSGNGSDMNDGCTLAKPKQTIGAAINYVKVLGATGHSIHVCRGSYVETKLTLDYAVDLMGGYDCATGLRPSDYGYPTFNSNSLSTISTTPPNDGTTTVGTLALAIPPADAGARAVVVDGLHVVGPASGTAQTSVAVQVTGAGAVTLTNDWITGGTTTSPTTTGTIGVTVTLGAAPEIANCTIEGGAGTGTASTGSIGIFVRASGGAPYVHDSIVRGGSGTGTSSGSFAVYRAAPASGTVALRLAHMQIEAGSGTASAPTDVSGAGVVASGTDLTLTDSLVTGGTTKCGATCNVAGIRTSGGSLMLQNDRIYGGDAAPASGQAAFFGVDVDDATSVVLRQNMIHPGNETKPTAATAGSYALRISASSAATAVTLDANTFRLFGVAAEPANGVLLSFADPTPPFAATIRNNLFLAGGADANTTALVVGTGCEGAVATLTSNAFVGATTYLFAPSHTGPGQCGAQTSFTDVTSLVARFTAETKPATATGNVAVSTSCSVADAGAMICSTPPGALSAADCVHATCGSTAPSAELVASGWKLVANAPCSIVKGGADLSALLATDLYGTKRTAPLSIGAVESDATCQ